MIGKSYTVVGYLGILRLEESCSPLRTEYSHRLHDSAMPKITHFEIHGQYARITYYQHVVLIMSLSDVRFPTSLTGDGTDAMYAHDLTRSDASKF